MEKFKKLPDAELEVMKAIWAHETPVSTSQVKEYLEQSRPWSVSALQTLLNRLIARGFLSSEKRGKNRYNQKSRIGGSSAEWADRTKFRFYLPEVSFLKCTGGERCPYFL